MTSRVILASAALLVLVVALVSGAAAQAPRDASTQGETLFFTQGCYGCHRLGRAGTPIAYDLSHVGRKYSEGELVQWLRDPSRQKPTAHMPRLALTDDEIRALANYLASLK